MITELDRSYFEITGTKLNNSSQLKSFNILRRSDGQTFLNIFRNLKIGEMDIQYFWMHQLDYDDWWDGLSYQYYETPRLWWTIPLINGIENPFETPSAGTNIRILKGEYIYTILNEMKELSQR